MIQYSIKLSKKWFLLSILFLGGVLQISAADPASIPGGASVNSVLASVNGDPVTLLDVVLETAPFERELAVIHTGERLNREIEKLRRTALEDIITRRLICKEYEEEPFQVPEQMIENMIDEHAKLLGGLTRKELEQRLKQNKMTLADLKKKMRERIIVNVILIRNCDKQVVVTPKDVYEEYQKNLDRWTHPAQVGFQMIQLNKENPRSGIGAADTAEKLTSVLAAGASEELFIKLMDEYSDGPRNGFSASVELPKLRPEFQSAVKDKKTGDIVGPIDTPEAIFFIRINSLQLSTPIPFEKAAPELEEQLRRDAIRKKRDEYSKQLRAKALIQYYI